MTGRRLRFSAPRTVEIQSIPVPDPSPEQVRVTSTISAISAGTERTIYRGEAPREMARDKTIDALDDDFSFPLTYGYATVGRVTAIGSGVDEGWLDRRVFAYNPHESHFVVDPSSLVPVPDGLSTRVAALFANAETAVTFLLDGRPMIGERVVVFGQGVVGLLTTALLDRTPLDALVTVDRIGKRRELSSSFGADRTLDPDRDDVGTTLESLVGSRADLTYELSGNPSALNEAITVTGFDGRIVVGSWYGTKSVDVDLGRRFHRDRIDIRSSQVSTIPTMLEGRWSRDRRHEVTWQCIETLSVDGLFTHEFPVERADEAYQMLDAEEDEALQVFLTYD